MKHGDGPFGVDGRAATPCEDGSASAGEVMHDSSFFAAFLDNPSSLLLGDTQSTWHGNGTPDAMCNGRGQLVSKWQCACLPGFGGELCGKVRTRNGCLCDPTQSWPESDPMRAHAIARAAASSPPRTPAAAREAACHADLVAAGAPRLRCYVDPRSCERPHASARDGHSDARLPWGAIRPAEAAWDWC